MGPNHAGGIGCIDFWCDNLTCQGAPDRRAGPLKCISNCGLWHLRGRLPPGDPLHLSGTAVKAETLM